MGDLVGHPKRHELRRQPHAVGFGVHPSGEVLDADERHAPASDHQLTGVRGPHADHEDAIGGTIDLENVFGAMQGLFGQPGDVDLAQHGVEVAAVRAQRSGDHFERVGTLQVEDVVAPVGGEQGAVRIEEAVVGRFGI
jgi:hypothetical protein